MLGVVYRLFVHNVTDKQPVYSALLGDLHSTPMRAMAAIAYSGMISAEFGTGFRFLLEFTRHRQQILDFYN